MENRTTTGEPGPFIDTPGGIEPDTGFQHQLGQPFGTRQIFDMTVDLVQTSCGMSVPFYDYRSDRHDLRDWAEKKGDEGLRQYWAEKNQQSIDGLPSGILERNT